MDATHVQPAPVPIPFPVEGANPGPRCGHTLTVVIGADQKLSSSKLVMFGACPEVERGPFVVAPLEQALEPSPCSCRWCNSSRRSRWGNSASCHCGWYVFLRDPQISRPIERWRSITRCFAGIRLAGATNDVHIMDFETGKWSKIEPLGDLPAPRAAHAAVAVGSMMVVQASSWII